MVATGGDIEYSKEISRLTRGEQHRRATAFQSANLRCYRIASGVLQTGIEITARFQIKQFTHVFAGGVFKRSALDNGHLAGFTVARGITALYAGGFNAEFVFAHNNLLARVRSCRRARDFN